MAGKYFGAGRRSCSGPGFDPERVVVGAAEKRFKPRRRLGNAQPRRLELGSGVNPKIVNRTFFLKRGQPQADGIGQRIGSLRRSRIRRHGSDAKGGRRIRLNRNDALRINVLMLGRINGLRARRSNEIGEVVVFGDRRLGSSVDDERFGGFRRTLEILKIAPVVVGDLPSCCE
jgi:hypothetical protein